jgi:hypothetical protein
VALRQYSSTSTPTLAEFNAVFISQLPNYHSNSLIGSEWITEAAAQLIVDYVNSQGIEFVYLGFESMRVGNFEYFYYVPTRSGA